MPFEMECVRAVGTMYREASGEAQQAFDRTLASICRDPTIGEPLLKHNVPGALNVRKLRFEFGTIFYRYSWDDQDAAVHILVTGWKHAEP